MKRDPDRAEFAARTTEAAGVGQLGMPDGVASGFEDGADRARDRGAVAVSPTAPIDRAGVETGTAADARQRFAESRAPEKLASAVVDDDDVQGLGGAVCPGARTPEMRCVGGDRLTGGRTSQQTQKWGEVGPSGDDLLQADHRDVQGRQGRAEVGVSFVGADDEGSRLGDGEIDAGDARLRAKETIAEVATSHTCQFVGIVQAGRTAHFSSEESSDFRPAKVDCRHHDMTGCFVAELNDAFAEIRIDDFEPPVFEIRIQATFLGEHGLALDDPFDAVLVEELRDDRVVLGGISRPMHLGTRPSRVGFELLPEFGQSRQGMSLDRAGLVA